MNWNMVTDSELAHQSVSERFLEYAKAYRNAASVLCASMISERSMCTWPNANVTLLLAAHATELFLKGAILAKDPTALVEHHLLDDLNTEYKKRFVEPSFEWDIPFKTEWGELTEAEIRALKKTTPVPSMLYRYPVAKGGKEWNGAFGFEPNLFASTLDQLGLDFQRIMARIAQQKG
ncbi:hypothetical protein [Duganella violaceipulchra]|uniref:Uncharacterized protein n=1 Tax=Duganella violaceipulchra TaxID=2849652 RepID=A0AA41H3C5_9BURK|nr:hypothetical protein [Duganella violaceicalia]MBV6319998.1 hypothetical protein [Duganella violaceicalia]MCP2010362.1 hypothetical protein [Duganella violaceicalia]